MVLKYDRKLLIYIDKSRIKLGIFRDQKANNYIQTAGNDLIYPYYV